MFEQLLLGLITKAFDLKPKSANKAIMRKLKSANKAIMRICLNYDDALVGRKHLN